MDVTYQHSDQTTPPGDSALPRPDVRLDLKTQRRLVTIALLLLDVAALALAMAVAHIIRFYVPLHVFRDVEPDWGRSVLLAGCMILVWMALFFLSGLYAEHNLMGGTREYALVFNACTIASLLVIVTVFLVETLIVSRGLLVLTWLLSFLFVGGGAVPFPPPDLPFPPTGILSQPGRHRRRQS